MYSIFDMKSKTNGKKVYNNIVNVNFHLLVLQLNRIFDKKKTNDIQDGKKFI